MKIALDTFAASVVRTFTPIVVGAVVGFLVASNVPLDPEFEVALTGVITVAFQGVYYVAVRLFEKHVSPKFGWLLGNPSQPVAYVTSDVKETQVHTDKVHTSPDTAQIIVHQSK